MKKFIFFRNDDVWKLDKNLELLIDIFLSSEIPLHLSVIPGKLTEPCKNFLTNLTKKHPDLIELGQHGFKHINYCNLSDKFLKYEFGEERSHEEQKADILKGRKIMSLLNFESKIFIPPWHGFDDNTLKILADANYSIISTDLKKPVPDNIYNLRSIPTSMYLNERCGKGWHTQKAEKIIRKINNIKYDKIGIQIHHKAFNNLDDFNQLKKLLRKLKGDNSINIIKLSEGFENNILKGGIHLNSLIYYLTYQFVPKHLILTKNSKNPILEDYDFQDMYDYKLSEKTESQISKELYIKLKKAIRKKLPGNNGPIGLLLSGGMDSAAILHILRELTDRKIFTITGAYSKHAPNLKFAEQLASKYNTAHQEIIIDPEDLLKLNVLYSKNTPQPIGDNGFLSTYLMVKKLKGKTKIIFSGDGADCLFAGLKSHYLDYIDNKYFSGIKTDNFSVREFKKISSIKKRYPNFGHYRYGEIFFEKEEVKRFFNLDIDLTKPLREITKKIKTRDILKKQILVDLNFLVKNRVEYILESSRINRVHIVLPYLDRDFVKYVLSIPSEYIIKNLNQKYILKIIFENKLPKEILKRENKGFTPPFKLWYLKNKDFVIKTLIKSAKLGISKEYITYLVKNLNKSDNYRIGMKIWLILNVVCWFENNDFLSK